MYRKLGQGVLPLMSSNGLIPVSQKNEVNGHNFLIFTLPRNHINVISVFIFCLC